MPMPICACSESPVVWGEEVAAARDVAEDCEIIEGFDMVESFEVVETAHASTEWM